MEFDIHKRKKEVSDSYPKDVTDIAYSFSKKVYKEFAKFIKAIVLFGSTARKGKVSKGDIDILIIVDDVSIVMDREFVQAYRIIINKIVAEVAPKKLHITTLKFTSFWEYVRAGDPVAVNILRDGVPIIDSGFFEPIQLLLFQGRIRPSTESMWNYFNKAPITLHNSKWHIKQGVIDLYWAVIDAAHAALMKLNEVPPSPSHVADLLETKMVKRGLLPQKYADMMRKFYNISRTILHGEITEISGAQFDEYYKLAKEFVEKMQMFIEGRN
ncbi:MAG: nucleotidyltransferase domain-containing protein [Nanoarchaeota archaeon]|nr:nucleotidyltransferase domain-containing protein [Nanoarchaeota archaeon]MBU1321966.1 nucleotidyltransferase domain-containing protein [Nanoarchaeota archaeon]MBU1597456.1 nucleotidyltransferase domain-containing protein [Nanoarchaeota archaeon]MBU2442375.1 nucleotidyltransferase domain-containing protein [Nanoarchaeota archaeon]